MLPEMSLGSFRLFLSASDLEPKPSFVTADSKPALCLEHRQKG
jgi:hypothetical protein